MTDLSSPPSLLRTAWGTLSGHEAAMMVYILRLMRDGIDPTVLAIVECSRRSYNQDEVKTHIGSLVAAGRIMHSYDVLGTRRHAVQPAFTVCEPF